VSSEKPSPDSQTLGFRARRHYNVARSRSDSQQEAWRRKTLASTPSPGPDDINQEHFDQLLLWLDPDQEKAAAHYERIRRGLIKIFVSRGAQTADELADKTINRVARKVPEIRSDYVGDPAHYFYAVARYIWHEELTRQRTEELARQEMRVSPPPTPQDPDGRDYACLEKCLHKLSQDDRRLVIAYYQEEKTAKIDHRRKLAEELGLSRNALAIRAFRIRASLSRCFEICRSATG